MDLGVSTYFKKQANAAPLAVFRILFGLMVFASIVRFWALGWIEKRYIEPKFFFTYYGFSWVQPLGNYTYLIFILCGIAALGIALGYKYRLSAILFFLSFGYIELMDKTTYLNHYYFISCVSFLLIFLPANAYFSMDAYKNPKKRFSKIPQWTIDSLKLFMGLVYVYAGLAKLNSDWMLHALPLKIWLPAKSGFPLIGFLFAKTWVAYVFSWVGTFYDLSIPFLLLYKRTRWFAFGLVVAFHVLTAVLFPIGMFPYIMIISSLIFFSAEFHQKIIRFFSKVFHFNPQKTKAVSERKPFGFQRKCTVSILTVFFAFQLLWPWRYLPYPGELFWNEEGFRFSWRVMLMEKRGYAEFKVEDRKTGKHFYVQNEDFLTPFQQKQMRTQPDFIVQYAHYLGKHFAAQGHKNIAIYVDSYVSLNGRLSQPFINPKTDLMKVDDSFAAKSWILPFKGTIKGL